MAHHQATTGSLTLARLVAAARPYVAVARTDHWLKNVLVVPGPVLAATFGLVACDAALVARSALAILCACLVASFNYVINEVLDAPHDRAHPTKRRRPLAEGRAQPAPALALGVLCLAAALGVSYAWLNPRAMGALAALAGMGVLYNVPPLRLKDWPLLDVIAESANSPLRLVIGWYAVGVSALPTASLILGYWAVGAFLMTAKRLAELRFIGDPARAACYRRSFGWYSEHRLLLLMVVYACGTLYFAGILTAKYHPELMLSVPFLCLFIAWLVHLTLGGDSVVREPERIGRRPALLVYTLLLALLIVALSMVHWPVLRSAFELTGQPW